MKTLAEQVKTYMDWRSDQSGEEFSPADMAAEVARHQIDLPQESRCTRQNIESIFSKGLKTTRYLVALAKAMRTTAEVLQDGRYTPSTPTDSWVAAVESEAAIQVELLANSGSMGEGSDILHDDVLVGRLTLSPEWVKNQVRPTSTQALRFIHAYGDSMTPTFSDGDVLLVDTGSKNPSGADGVYVLSTTHRIFIKRVSERLEGGFDVTSDNPKVKTIGSLNGKSQINVLGRVIWAWNGRKL